MTPQARLLCVPGAVPIAAAHRRPAAAGWLATTQAGPGSQAQPSRNFLVMLLYLPALLAAGCLAVLVNHPLACWRRACWHTPCAAHGSAG